MKKLLLVFACAFVFGLASSVFTQTKPIDPKALDDYSPEKWKTYEFKEDKFKIRFPGTPTEALGTKALSSPFVRKNLISYAGVVRYSILVFGLSVDLEKGGTADKIIEGAKSAATQSAPNESHKVIREEKISVSGHPGKFLQVEVGSDIVQRSRIVVVGDHMYLLLVSSGRTAANVMGSENDYEKIAMTFLDSFEPIM